MRQQTIVASVLLHDRGRAEAAICKDRFGCSPLHLAFTVSVSKDRSISTDSRNGLRREGCPSVREGHDVPVLFFSVDGRAYLSLDTVKLLSGLQGLAFGESFDQNVDRF